MRLLGLHLRLQNSLQELMQQALRLKVPIFQCFLTEQANGKVLCLTDEQIERFRIIRFQSFDSLYLHASYKTNLCRPDRRRFFTFRKEITLAQKLGFTHIVIHPGAAKWCRDKQRGLEALVQSLDMLLEEDHDITFVLENVAHGRYSIGGDLNDFTYVLDHSRYPEKIMVCIDTAHAFSYGYDVATESGQKNFISLLEMAFGIEKIALFHINNTSKALGQQVDQHTCIDEGNIPIEALKRFVLHEKLRHVPAIMELPLSSEARQYEQYNFVSLWHQELVSSTGENAKRSRKIDNPAIDN